MVENYFRSDLNRTLGLRKMKLPEFMKNLHLNVASSSVLLGRPYLPGITPGKPKTRYPAALSTFRNGYLKSTPH